MKRTQAYFILKKSASWNFARCKLINLHVN